MEKYFEEEILSDGSIGYNLILDDGEGGGCITLHCQNEKAAMRLLAALEEETVDF